MKFTGLTIMIIALAASAFAATATGRIEASTTELFVTAQATCPVCGGRITPEGCKGAKKTKPKTQTKVLMLATSLPDKMSAAAFTPTLVLSGDQCHPPKPTGSGKPRPKPFGPRTRSAMELANTAAFHRNLQTGTEKTSGGCTTRGMNKHISRHALNTAQVVVLGGPPLTLPRPAGPRTQTGGGDGGNPYAGGGGGARKKAGGK